MMRVRFAPSPTGFLHIGNVRTALFNYLVARKNNGSFILRIEDTDKERSKDEFIEHIYTDLSWLGIEWDEGPDKGGDFGPYRQSERFARYKEYADKLLKEGKAYHCFCTEEELEERRKQQVEMGKTANYDNRCRDLCAMEREKLIAEGRRPCIRFKVKNTKLVLKDIIRGAVEFDLSFMGDFVIMRPDGSPTFHLAVCVDDGLMKITHVVRGEDHLSNTPRHVLIFEACGFPVPHFAHMPLTMGPGGEPLSKRLGAMSIAEYRKQGFLPEALCNYMALLGWSSGDDRELYNRSELIKAFSLKRVSRSAAVFDKTKLNWMGGEHIRLLSDAEYTTKAVNYIVQEKLIERDVYSKRPEWFQKVLLVFKENLGSFSELKERLVIFADKLVVPVDLLRTYDSASAIFEEMETVLMRLEKLEEDEFDKMLKTVKKHTKVKGKELFMPVRLAVTGREHGPDLKKVALLLGKNVVLARVQQALRALESEQAL